MFGDCLDLEVLEQIRAILLGDVNDTERAVVAPSLQYLREETLDTPTMSGQCRVEKHQPRGVLLESGSGHSHISTSIVVLKGEDLALCQESLKCLPNPLGS